MFTSTGYGHTWEFATLNLKTMFTFVVQKLEQGVCKPEVVAGSAGEKTAIQCEENNNMW